LQKNFNQLQLLRHLLKNFYRVGFSHDKKEIDGDLTKWSQG